MQIGQILAIIMVLRTSQHQANAEYINILICIYIWNNY